MIKALGIVVLCCNDPAAILEGFRARVAIFPLGIKPLR